MNSYWSKQHNYKQRPALDAKAGRFVFNAVIPAPFGALGICTGLDILGCPVVIHIQYLPAQVPPIVAIDAFTGEVVAQLQAYLKNPAFVFDVPLNRSFTLFQERLRQQMLKIPVGQVQTYGHVAQILKSGARAVGQACAANPLPLLVPCHRVVAARGIGGFSGRAAREKEDFYVQIKRWLLTHEGNKLV